MTNLQLVHLKHRSIRCTVITAHHLYAPFPPLDNIRVMVTVWRLRGNIIRTALCWIVWHNVHSPQHTYVSSSYRSNWLGLSHWDPYAVRRGGCLELYYCNMVEWFWCDSSLILTTNWFPSVLWHCWFGHLACKNRPRNDLLCVEWDVKPYTLTHPTSFVPNNKICTSSNHCQQNGNWRFVDLLEDVFEPAIILLQNGVLCAHVQRPFLLYSILETAVSEAGDRLKHKVTHIKHLRTHWSLNSHKETFKLYFIT